ncbi:ATP synthase F1 subunit delta [Desulfurobacterium crinifex]
MRLEVRIARRYAKALADVLPTERLEKINEEIKTLISLLDDKAIRYFRSPVVPLEKKKGLMEQILEKAGVSEELKKVLLLMAQKDRLGIIREFASEFEKFVDFRLGIVKAEIVSAVEIDEETLSRIKEKIENLFGKKAEITVKLDPSLIGGFIVKVADKVLDASIKTQLEMLKKAIAD